MVPTSARNARTPIRYRLRTRKDDDEGTDGCDSELSKTSIPSLLMESLVAISFAIILSTLPLSFARGIVDTI